MKDVTMQVLLLFINLALFSHISFASPPQLEVKLQTEAIYWLDAKRESAVVYARFDNFHNMLNLAQLDCPSNNQ